MGPPKTAERNREIFAAFEAGVLAEQLASEYRLTLQRISAILIAEKHKRELSLEPVYRQIRQSNLGSFK